jgi:hypothetical protein
MIGHWPLRLRRQILDDLVLIRGPVLDPVRGLVLPERVPVIAHGEAGAAQATARVGLDPVEPTPFDRDLTRLSPSTVPVSRSGSSLSSIRRSEAFLSVFSTSPDPREGGVDRDFGMLLPGLHAREGRGTVRCLGTHLDPRADIKPSDEHFDYGAIKPDRLARGTVLLCAEVPGGRKGATSRRVCLMRGCPAPEAERLLAQLVYHLAEAAAAGGDDVVTCLYVYPSPHPRYVSNHGVQLGKRVDLSFDARSAIERLEVVEGMKRRPARRLHPGPGEPPAPGRRRL